MHIIHLLSNYSKTTMPLAQPEEKVTSFVYRSPVWKLSFIGGDEASTYLKFVTMLGTDFLCPITY